MEKKTFWLPTRPFDLVAAVNRAALATGSTRYAMLGESADYNGHRVDFVEPNSYKRYWTCGYTWAGWNVLARGTLADCLAAAKREYDGGALGACSRVEVTTEEDEAACLAAGFSPWTKEVEEAWNATWKTDLHGEVHGALDWERRGLLPGCVGLLVVSKSKAEFEGRREAALAERRAR